ncbi:hypothetical protein AB0C14_14595 [Microbispora hainanensis]|uniref:hypothetical protein n=1 Tax=Microbispora hainanensis TaxID=568844 RepID=UPI0033D9D748
MAGPSVGARSERLWRCAASSAGVPPLYRQWPYGRPGGSDGRASRCVDAAGRL